MSRFRSNIRGAACEQAAGIHIGRDTVRKWMVAAGLWESRNRKWRRSTSWRERRAYEFAVGALTLPHPNAVLTSNSNALKTMSYLIHDRDPAVHGRLSAHTEGSWSAVSEVATAEPEPECPRGEIRPQHQRILSRAADFVW